MSFVGAVDALNGEGWKPLDATLTDHRWVLVALFAPEAAAHAGEPTRPWVVYEAMYHYDQMPPPEGHTGWYHRSGGLWIVPTLYRETEYRAK